MVLARVVQVKTTVHVGTAERILPPEVWEAVTVPSRELRPEFLQLAVQAGAVTPEQLALIVEVKTVPTRRHAPATKAEREGTAPGV